MSIVLVVECRGCILDQELVKRTLSFVFWLNASKMLPFHLVFLYWLFPSSAVLLGPNSGATDAASSVGKTGCKNGQNKQLLGVAKGCHSSPVQQWQRAQTIQWQQKQQLWGSLILSCLSQYCSSFSHTQWAKAHTKVLGIHNLFTTPVHLPDEGY